MPSTRVFLLSIMLALGSLSYCLGQKGCQRPYTAWNEAYALQILTDCAWSKQMALGSPVYTRDRIAVSGKQPVEIIVDRKVSIDKRPVKGVRIYGLDRGTGQAGEKEIIHAYTLRLFSALPVRQAFVRVFQIENDYENIPEEQQKRLDVMFN
ncbi:MAG TPA: hypothetical protein PLP42_22400 [Acidobacteriota bacterium]|nr:hypothetical protein [Acidobacteriota bacterium]